MQLRYRSVLPLVVVCLALAIAPAFAAKPHPTPVGTPSGVTNSVLLGPSGSSGPSCELGVPPPVAIAFGYILPPDDEYYQLIDPSQCAGCGGAGAIRMAHVALYFTSPCEIPVTVSVKPAISLATGCLAPNLFADPICPPIEFLVNDAGYLNTCVDYQFPLPECCIGQPVFLEFRFDQGTCPNARPAFCGPDACNNCTQYNYYPGAGFPGDDLCAVLSPFRVYGINMWADVTCCGKTPTLQGSWGQLKTLYR